MNKAQKAIISSLLATSSVAWVASVWQPDMMFAMTFSPLSIAVFTASWTAGMAAMMFPAITPMVLLYSRFITGKEKGVTHSSITVQEGKPSSSMRSSRVILFTGSYLVVWALTGVALLLSWSVVMNNTIMSAANLDFLPYVYASLLIIAGIYQFTPIKTICIGYCESPMSFFIRRWREGKSGAIQMGLYHGVYCLGCCWAYFLLMVALGWMNLLWMGLFAGIIFAEKMWKRGIWVARAAGAGLIIVGVLVIAGMLPALVSSASSMGSNAAMQMNEEGGNKNDMTAGNGAENSMDMTSGDDSSETVGTTSANDNGGQGMQQQSIDSMPEYIPVLI